MSPSAAQERTWELADIYPSPEAWRAARRSLAKRLPDFEKLRGTIHLGSEPLRTALDAYFSLAREAEKLFAYASMLSDQDTRQDAAQGMRQSAEALLADFSTMTAWLAPEILALPPERLREHLAHDESLREYERYFEKVEKQRAHTLDHEQERLLGLAQMIRGDGEVISSILRNAEMPWPEVTLEGGRTVRIDPTTFTKERAAACREDRRRVFDAFHGTLKSYGSTMAAALYASVKEHVFHARARKYPTCLDAALSANEVDTAVYRMLVHEIRQALPTLYRYLDLRARILGVDDLRYFDIHAPLVQKIETDYSWEATCRLVLDALHPLGDRYVSDLKQAIARRWIDVEPRPGKRSGAYVNDGAYGVHPFMLLNHHSDYNSTSTFAHEAGHLMHSLYSQRTQRYPNAHYVIFVAEVASTLNETLLFHHALETAETNDQRLALLGNQLENLRGTVFRQTMFAEFEWKIHERVDAGEALTQDALNTIYAELVREYHGEASGHLTFDEAYAAEWSYVPHFHYNFYVYQYATSFIASTDLARRILQGNDEARERYLRFLSAGSTKAPVDLLIDAGVDITSPIPFRSTMAEMEEVMDQIESLL